MDDRFVLVDQAQDGSLRFLTTAGTWSDLPREACRFWTVAGARNSVPWHDLLHARVLPEARALELAATSSPIRGRPAPAPRTVPKAAGHG